MTVVPRVLNNLKDGLQARLNEQTGIKRLALNVLISINKMFTGSSRTSVSADVCLSRFMQGSAASFQFFVGGAFTEPDTLRFFR